jgi:hypothetical protein
VTGVYTFEAVVQRARDFTRLDLSSFTTTGASGTATFRYSLDGGDTYSATYATAATFLLPSGVTANMAAGTYVISTTYTWTDTAPALTSLVRVRVMGSPTTVRAERDFCISPVMVFRISARPSIQSHSFL